MQCPDCRIGMAALGFQTDTYWCSQCGQCHDRGRFQRPKNAIVVSGESTSFSPEDMKRSLLEKLLASEMMILGVRLKFVPVDLDERPPGGNLSPKQESRDATLIGE